MSSWAKKNVLTKKLHNMKLSTFFLIFLFLLQIVFYKLILGVRVYIETLRHVLLYLFCDTLIEIFWRIPKGFFNFESIDSPKKRMGGFVLFAFLLFNKSKSSVHFMGESTSRQSAFWFYLTFTS
jgi:hypothetical protein